MMLVSMLSAPAWQRNTQKDSAAGLEAPEPGRGHTFLDPGHEPITAGPARVGFQGIRKNAERILGSFLMPGVPGMPPNRIASRRLSNPTGQPAVMPIRAAAVLTPIVGVEQTAPWYEDAYGVGLR